MFDFLNTILSLSDLNTAVNHFVLGLIVIAGLGLVASMVVEFFFSFKDNQLHNYEAEEKQLMTDFNILFQLKIRNEKLSKDSSYERTKLSEISNRLDLIRGTKISSKALPIS